MVGDSVYANKLSIYKGQSGDYFDFRADSNIYIKEGSLLDTAFYLVLPNGTIEIGYKVNIPYVIADDLITTSTITANTAILFTIQPFEPLPSGSTATFYKRHVYLSR